jgi:hypothetical protein
MQTHKSTFQFIVFRGNLKPSHPFHSRILAEKKVFGMKMGCVKLAGLQPNAVL